jgi:hypothetical protein
MTDVSLCRISSFVPSMGRGDGRHQVLRRARLFGRLRITFIASRVQADGPGVGAGDDRVAGLHRNDRLEHHGGRGIRGGDQRCDDAHRFGDREHLPRGVLG